MATAIAQNPSREDFAAMLEESFNHGSPQEGTVVTTERLADNYDRMAATERHKVRELEAGDG